MKGFRDLALVLFIGMFVLIIIVGAMYNFYLQPVSSNKDEKVILIDDSKDIKGVITTLKENNLIRNPKVFKIYLNIYGIKTFKTGEFKLSENMSAKEIAKIISDK